MRGLWSALALVCSVAAGPAAAQGTPAGPTGAAGEARFAVAARPDTVTVGDRFVSTVRVVAPPGARVEFTALAVSDSVQPIDTLRAGVAGQGSVAAAYSLVAWVAGVPLEARAPVRVTLPDGTTRRYLVPLALPTVRSVLPPDTAGLRPRAARGVVALPRREIPWLPLVAGGLAAGALAALWWHRRRPRPPPRRNPREEALAALDRLAPLAGDQGALHAAVSRVLRRYLAAVDPGWGEPWTTTELRARLRADGVDEVWLAALAGLLERADRAKFARAQPSPAETEELVVQARRWVESYPPAPAPREAA